MGLFQLNKDGEGLEAVFWALAEMTGSRLGGADPVKDLQGFVRALAAQRTVNCDGRHDTDGPAYGCEWHNTNLYCPHNDRLYHLLHHGQYIIGYNEPIFKMEERKDGTVDLSPWVKSVVRVDRTIHRNHRNTEARTRAIHEAQEEHRRLIAPIILYQIIQGLQMMDPI